MIQATKLYRFIHARLRRLALCHQTFIGTYWKNEADIRLFIINHPIIVLHKQRMEDKNISVPVKLVMPGELTNTPNPEEVAAIINKRIVNLRESARLKGKKELQQTILFYVQDNAYNRKVLGFKETEDHLRLTTGYHSRKNLRKLRRIPD